MWVVCIYIGRDPLSLTLVLNGSLTATRREQTHFFGIRQRPNPGSFRVRVNYLTRQLLTRKVDFMAKNNKTLILPTNNITSYESCEAQNRKVCRL